MEKSVYSTEIKPIGSYKKSNRIRSFLQKWLPWIVTITIFIYLFNQIPIDEVLAAFKRANLLLFLPILITFTILFFFGDSYIASFLFTRFGTIVTFRDMVPIRGTTYLITVLNYMVGQGGLALIMNRLKKTAISRTTSIVIFNLHTDYFTLLAFCLGSAFRLPDVDMVNLFDSSEAGHLVRFVIISWIVFILHIGFYRWFLPRSSGFTRIKGNRVLSSFVEGPVLRYFQIMFMKSILFMTGIVANYYALQAFGLHVPFWHLSVMLPIVWLIGSIPITVMRMGTIQAAMLWLVAQHAQGGVDPEKIRAAVLAYSLLWEIVLNMIRFIIGAICITQVPRHIWMPKTKEEIKE